MEARKRKMEERRIGVGRKARRARKKNEEERTGGGTGCWRMRTRTGKVLPRKFLEGTNRTSVRTSKPTRRSIDPEPAAWFLYLLFSLCLLLSPARETATRWKPKVAA